jgi:hypothetical protein
LGSLGLKSELVGERYQTRDGQGVFVDHAAAARRLDIRHDAASHTQPKQAGECRIAAREGLLRSSCREVSRHRRYQGVPEHKITEAKDSGTMQDAPRDNSRRASARSPYSILDPLSRIPRLQNPRTFPTGP